MAATARPPKQPRKGVPDNNPRSVFSPTFVSLLHALTVTFACLLLVSRPCLISVNITDVHLLGRLERGPRLRSRPLALIRGYPTSLNPQVQASLPCPNPMAVPLALTGPRIASSINFLA